MDIILIRHGEAFAPQIRSERPLTKRGEQDVKSLCHFISHLQIKFKKLVHSDILRAQQTASIIIESLELTNKVEIQEVNNLRPESSFVDWANYLEQIKAPHILVGHMPFMSLLTEELSQELLSFPSPAAIHLSRQSDSSWRVSSRSF